MSFIARLQRAREILAQQGRLSTRALERELETGGDELDELVEELVDVQQVARREGRILVWTGGAATPPPDTSAPSPRTTAPTQRAADESETRKVISIIFADLMGSTALHEELDPESVNRVMNAYYASVRGPVEAAGGTVVQLLGDGVLCAFGIPRIAEDDALRAVRAAVGIQQAFREFLHGQQGLRVPIGLRVAVNTGEVVVSDEHPAGIGDPLNVAARLQQEARDGEVLIGPATRRLVADAVTLERAGVFALKGRAETVTAYRVLSLERPTGTTAAFVGRDEELARLSAAYEAAVATPAAGLAVLLGSPGLGKSRLIDELGHRAGDAATVIAAQCDAAGGATFAPVAEALRQFLGDRFDPSDQQSAIAAALAGDAAERTRIAAGITAVLGGSPPSPEETFFVIRRFLTALAKEKPVMLVIDDLQWAEPLLLDLVEHLIQWGSGVPLFVLVGARPELRNRRSSLATAGGLVSEVITLSGLDAGAAMRLAANVIGAADLPAAVVAKVLATSEGNPLFVGELVRMLVDEGAIEKQGERWIVGANLAALEMPPTIHALLAARLERLRPEERTVLERASVVGRQFSRGALAALLGENGSSPRAEASGEVSALDARLEALRRTELIEPDTGWLLGEPVLRFHHVLIRDAAYRRLLKGTRAELHERLANWMEAQVRNAPRTPEASGGRAEHDETIGRHLEQAHHLLGEIGPLDASGKELGERAAHRLSDAGRRALERDDAPVAADLLGRAVACLNWGDADAASLPPEAVAPDASLPPETLGRRAELALDWCEALLAAGDVAGAAEAIDELARCIPMTASWEPGTSNPEPRAAGSRRLRAWHACFSGHLTVMTAPQELQAAADAVAAAANEFTELDDAAGEAKAHFVHALALARLGRVGACEGSLDRALAAARRAGDRRRANTVLAIAPLAALWGPSPVTRASGRCLDVVRVLRITQGAPAVEAVALSCQGVLEALRGRTEAAHRMIASGRKMVEELGIAQRLFETDVFAGFVALLEGDAPAAEPTLRGAYDGLRELGLGIDAARAAALLARALLAQERIDEAEALSHESEALAGDDLKAAIAWRGVRAEALAKRGEQTEAVELARAAVAIAAATDALLDHADARLALAAALRAAGRGAEADKEDWRANELWEAKGATLLAERAGQRITKTVRPERAPSPGADDTRVDPPAYKPPPGLVPGKRGGTRRRVRPNAASALMGRMEVACRMRDLDSIVALHDDSMALVDHPNGSTCGLEGVITTFERMLRSPHFEFRFETVATLGESLCFGRRLVAGRGTAGVRFDVAEYDMESVILCEVGDEGRLRRCEVFAPDHLRDAVVRLYERHAALLPEGAVRTRAAATAQSMAVLRSANADPERLAPVLAPDIEGIDHRHLSNWSLRGAPAYLDHLRALHQVADDVDFRWEEVLALAPGALLTRNLHRGTERVGRGPYERCFLSLFVVGADGRITRAEWFDDDREAEALARFEELVPGPVDGIGARDEVSRLVPRRVRPNAASALTKGIQAGFAARDRDAIEALLADPLHTVEHPTGATYGREDQLESIDRMLRLPKLAFRMELLATLGDVLCLARRRVNASGTAGGRFDVAEFEMDHVGLQEVDADGRLRRSEVFASEHLGAAIVRLYERHADLSPEGPAREQAAATARTIAAVLGPPDLDAWRACLAAGVEFEDHRILGFGSLRGREATLPYLESLFETSASLSSRIDDVLALEPGAFLVHWTESGVAAEGGDFERVQLALWILDGEGLVARVEYFDVDREADAIARFEARTGAPSPPARRRVRANAATRSFDHGREAVTARDADAFAELFDESLTVVHHPTRASYGRRGHLASWRSAMRAERLEFRQEFLASLGDTLALEWHVITVAGLAEAHRAGFGASMLEELSLFVVDERGRFIRTENFAPDRLGDAIVRLYELYAESLPEGSGRNRAAGVARALPALNGPIDPDRVAAANDPAARNVDHRVFGTWTTSDAAEVVRHYRQQLDLAPDFAARFEGVLALEPDRLLARMSFFGTARESGGAFENRVLLLVNFSADGRLGDTETFEAEQENEALARFDALAGGPREGDARPSPADRGFSNAASRLNERFARAWAERDWNAVSGAYVAGHHVDDRRRLMQMRLPDGDARAALRFLFDVPGSRWVVTPLATRGEHLVVSRYVFEGTAGADAGPIAIDYVALDQTDADGRFIETVLFDPDDLDAAYAELDRRYGAGDGRHDATWQQAHRLAAALPHGDIDACRAMLAPGFRVGDHRTLGWGDTLRDADTFLQAQIALTELSPDWRYRIDHRRARGLVWLGQQAQVGTREGGAFENRFLIVGVSDQQGLVLGFDIYDVDQLDQARARFEELAVPVGATHRFANTASRMAEKQATLFAAKDWQAFRQLSCESFRYLDRRRIALLELDRDQHLAFLREAGEGRSIRNQVKVLATRGERLALWHYLVEFTDDDIGPSELEFVTVTEVDSHGLLAAAVRFEPDDLAAAYAELDARYEAGEAATPSNNWLSIAGFVRAVERRDWDAVRALCRDDFVEQDHRGLALLGGTEGADAWVDNFRTLVELAPDTVYRAHHVLEAARGYFVHGSWYGTREGGPYELQVNAVLELDDAGRFRRADIYDDAVADAAFARLAELTPTLTELRRTSAPQTANAAMRAMSDWFDAYDRAFEAGTWDELRRGCHPGFVFDDRRRMALLRGSVDLMVASARERAAMGARPEWHPVGFCGDRLFVMRVLWVGGPSDGPFEIEYLGVVECDENGLFTAFVLFDLDDARAVQREAWARWAAIEPEVGAVPTPFGDAVDAFNEKNATKWRAAFADDLVVEDHRLAGMGRIEGADAYTESVVELWKLAPVTHGVVTWRWPALDRHGAIAVVHRKGTVPDGGGDFENEYLYLYVVAQERIARVEMFEMDALDKALARFEELRGSSDEAQGDRPPLPRPVLSSVEGGDHSGVDDAEPPPGPLLGKEGGQELQIPPNAATRGMDRWVEASLAGDADAAVALLDPSYTLEDRRPLFRTVSDRNAEIAVHLSLLHEGGWQPARTVLATAGDRLALQRWLWTKGESDARSEIEFLEIDELGDSGRFVRSILFAPEDRAAASRELMERYATLGAEGMPQTTIEFIRGLNAHDLVRARSGISADLVFDDHRRAGTGRLEGADRYLESLSALWELIPDDGTELLYNVAVDRYGRVCVLRTWGHNREGGEVESLFVSLMHHPGEKLSLIELFEIEHLDVALARLAELERGRVNTATRARDRQIHAFVAQDWDAIRRLATADFVLEDRGKRALVTGDVEAWIASMQFTSQPGWRPQSTLIGTFGNHIALDRVVWSGEPGGDAFELERIRVLEADAEGRMRAVIMFDPEDLWPASQDAMMRFAAAEGAEAAGALAAGNALNERRWDELRMGCAPDFVCVDHRPLALLGTLDREQWVESLKAIVGLSDGVTYANYDVLAWNERGIVTAVARHGTVPEGGGDFDDGFLAFYQVADGRLVRLDLFAEGDTEGALACFDAHSVAQG